jgi:hypothetical protein
MLQHGSTMMRFSPRGLIAASLIAAAFAIGGCQGRPVPAQSTTPQKKNVGGTIQANPSGGKFVVTGNRGTYTVDMSQSAFVRQGGKTIPATDLKAGAFITVSGMLDGEVIKAAKITLIHDKGQIPETPTAVGGSAGG